MVLRGKKSNAIRESLGSRIFDAFNYVFLAFAGMLCILPFLYVIGGSFATEGELTTRSFFIIPRTFTLDAYKYIFSTSALANSFKNTLIITIGGTAINLFFTVSMAYALAKKDLIGRNAIINMVIFCMLFGGGMIPTYLLVRNLGMLDTYWALWLPGAISPFNLFIVRNFFEEFPGELRDSAEIDGCNVPQTLWYIVLPLSKAVLATFALFYGVGHWNAFMGPLLYLNDSKKWPIQIILRNLIIASSGTAGLGSLVDMPPDYQPPAQALKLAVIVVATVPILLVYPFLQRYFVKGVMIGSLKG
ncbi:MAG: carbohydrate ABC transporter permease [Caldicoprobacter oshimai]|jgi:putative aldouronate transport system permease protein